ncbi:hypothetical protein GCM10020218_070550 [Dactylosporangium vinaceum]
MLPTLILVGLPVALVIIMLGLGLGLTVEDFRRVGRYPKAAVIALVCQLLILPAVCFGLVLAFGLEPHLAVGLLLLAASPGGPTANLYSHLFGGHVALNVALTAVNSLIIVVTLPIVANLSAGYFLPDSPEIGLQWTEVSQVFALVIVPVIAGMLVRARLPRVARRLDRPVRVLSIVVLPRHRRGRARRVGEQARRLLRRGRAGRAGVQPDKPARRLRRAAAGRGSSTGWPPRPGSRSASTTPRSRSRSRRARR